MFHTLVLSPVLALILAGALRAETSPPGAKELFYDPVDASVTNVSPGSTMPSKQGPSPKAGSSSRGSSGHSAPVQVDGNGRRQVSLPSVLRGRQSTAIGLSYWIELVEPEGGSGTQVADTRVFRSGERIRLHFRSNTDGHIALLQLGSSGAGRALFPDPGQGLTENRLIANQDRILPSAEHWFRFDDKPGTERLIVVFARSQAELDQIPIEQGLGSRGGGNLVDRVRQVRGSKDLLVETETRTASEVGTYGVSLSGQPVLLEIVLEHR
jgi:hypothetical protein